MSLDEEPLDRLERELGSLLGEEVSIGFYIGSPGAYRKSTALVLGETGRTLAFAKIATSPEARSNVEAERRNLLRLSGCPELHGQVPRVLGHFHWNGNEVLVISGGPPWPGTDSLASPQLNFCRSLFECSAAGQPAGVFADSPMYSRLCDTLERIESGLPGDVFTLMNRALQSLQEGLGDTRVPLSMAHRDFAPWNTRVGPMGLFVFDWDYATDSATPLYDPFHFRCIQSALFGEENHLQDTEVLESLLQSVWPQGMQHMSWLYLAYLLDMSLLYGEARVIAPEAGDDRVWRWLLNRTKSFLDDGSPL